MLPCENCGVLANNPRFCSRNCAGRAQGRKNVESAHLERLRSDPQRSEWSERGARNISYEDKVRGGRISSGGRRTATLHPELMRENGYRTAALYPERKIEWGRKGGRVGGLIGGPRTAKLHPELARERGIKGGISTAEKLRERPNRGEGTVAALFYTFASDVFADMIWFRGWKTGSLRGVPDFRHPTKVIGEFDGGGHHVFKDRSVDDEAKDSDRRAAGYMVIRETDPFILMSKFVYLVRRCQKFGRMAR